MNKQNIEESNPFANISSPILSVADITRAHLPIEHVQDQGIIVSLTEDNSILINDPDGMHSIGDSVDILSILDTNAILDENKYERYKSLIEKANQGSIFTAHVTKAAKKGLLVGFEELEAFLPQDQIGYDFSKDLSTFVDQEIEVKVISIKLKAKEGNRFLIIASHKIIVDEENRVNGENNLSVGMKVSGKVKSITNYGVFVNISPSVDGLIYLSDLSWNKVKDPSDIVSVGETIEVVILKIEELPNSKKKISLGLKQLSEHPWERLDRNLKEGDIVEGKVTKITDYGLFLKLPCGVDGLVHWTEISWQKSSSWDYTIGEHASARILSIDWENRKLLLSIKQSEADPWTNVEHLFVPGSIVHGTISSIKKKSGLFIRIQKGIDGFIPYSEIFWIGEVKKLHELFQVGEEIDSVVTDIDNEKRKIILSIRKQLPNPGEMLSIGQNITASIVDIKKSGIIVHLDNINQNGFIHNNKMSQEFNAIIGDRVTCKVEEIYAESRTILSV